MNLQPTRENGGSIESTVSNESIVTSIGRISVDGRLSQRSGQAKLGAAQMALLEVCTAML